MSQIETFKQMGAQQLADFVTKNPHLVASLDEQELITIQQKLNPYSQIPTQSTPKQVLFSFTNFKADYFRLLKSISLSKFLDQMVKEQNDWVDKVADLPTDEKDDFLKHIDMFRKHFLEFDAQKDCETSAHNQTDQKQHIPAQDFLMRWQRYEDAEVANIQQFMSKHFNYSTKYQCAIQVYDIFDSEDQVQKFIDRQSLSLGVDIIKADTNRWVILQDSEVTLDKTKFVGDDNEILEKLIQQMKKDQQLGEKMLKQRAQTKKNENLRETGPLPSDISEHIVTKASHTSQEVAFANESEEDRKVRLAHNQRRLELVDGLENMEIHTQCPILINQGGNDFQKFNL